MAKSGWIYFILARGAESFVKIGFSSVCPWARMNGIETGCPLPMELVAMVRGDQAAERGFHRAFAELRVRGEWFRWSGILIEFVNTLPAPDPVLFHRHEAGGRYNAGCADCHRIYLASRPKRRALS